VPPTGFEPVLPP